MAAQVRALHLQAKDHHGSPATTQVARVREGFKVCGIMNHHHLSLGVSVSAAQGILPDTQVWMQREQMGIDPVARDEEA